MAIKEEVVLVSVGNNMDSHYESLGYVIPKRKDKKGRITVPKGTKIEVNVDHLPRNSTIKLTKICDYCNKTSDKPQKYQDIIITREKNGKDCCNECRYIKLSEMYDNLPIDKMDSLAGKFPKIAKQWHTSKNHKSSWEISAFSDKECWWYDENCGHEWEATVKNRTMKKSECPYCANKKVCLDNCLATIFPDILEEWDYNKNNQIGLTPYNVIAGTKKYAYWKCKACSHEWKAMVQSRAKEQGTGCPCCKESKGEKRITDFLKKKGIKYSSQYRIKECKDVRALAFDFVVHQKEKLIFIEYDGIQHFKPIKFGGISEEKALREFKATQRRDRIKDEYCKTNNIKLIRISYEQYDNIETILDKELV